MENQQVKEGGEAHVSIPIHNISLEGDCYLPKGSKGLVIFAHGSGSSRFSPRNRHVAATLNEMGLGTLLIDLLTPYEEQIDNITRELRFDIPMLAERLIEIANWANEHPSLQDRKRGFFGSSTGAGAALLAHATSSTEISAVVSRGGRPDLAGEALHQVTAPTLLIVGGNDEVVIGLNEEAQNALNATSQLLIIPEATHLFVEPGTLDQVAVATGEWFQEYL